MTAGNTVIPLKAGCYITTGYANIALGGFIVWMEVDGSLPFYFTDSNKTFN